MKTLLCLSPQFRHQFAREALESLVERVILHLPSKPDAIGYFAPPDRGETSILNGVCNRTKWVFAEDPEFRRHQLVWDYGLLKTNKLRNNLLQWHALSQLCAMKEQLEREAGTKYDLVIWTRPDLYFVENLERIEDLERDTLWISPHDNWGSYNDRFCYGTSDAMGLRMRTYEHFENHFRRRVMLRSITTPIVRRLSKSYDKSSRWNAESVLGDLIEKHKIKVKKSNVLFFRIREDGGQPYVMLSDPAGEPGREFAHDCGSFDQDRFSLAAAKVAELYHSGKARKISCDHRERFVPLGDFQEAWGL